MDFVLLIFFCSSQCFFPLSVSDSTRSVARAKRTFCTCHSQFARLGDQISKPCTYPFPFPVLFGVFFFCVWVGSIRFLFFSCTTHSDNLNYSKTCLNPSTVFHTKIRIPVRINFPWQQHLVPWSALHNIMLIDCPIKNRVQRYQEHHRVVFEVFELSSAKEGRVSLLVDVFPCASWSLVKVRTSAWRATWKTLVLGLTWREWAQE